MATKDMTLYQYVSKHNPEGAAQIIRKYGYKPHNSQYWNSEALRELVNKYGQPALDDIATVHPDYELIVRNYQVPTIIENKTKTIEIPEQKSCNCGGHTNFSGPKCNCGNCQNNNRSFAPRAFSYADGSGDPNQQSIFLIKREHLVMLGAIAALGTMWLYFKNQGAKS